MASVSNALVTITRDKPHKIGARISPSKTLIDITAEHRKAAQMLIFRQMSGFLLVYDNTSETPAIFLG